MVLPAAGVCLRNNRSESFYYLNQDDYAISVWQHTPGDDVVRDRAILICPPIGYEYTHTHRTLRRMAEYFCDCGFYVFRLDYCGTGDSSGPEYCDSSLERWMGDILTVSGAVQESFPNLKQTWIGLRLGATLAYLAAESAGIDSLVMWAPIIKGRSYIRELEAISKLASVQQESSDEYFECAGFIISRTVAKKVKNINLLKSDFSPRIKRLLVVASGTEDHGTNLADLAKDHLIESTCAVMEGFEDMMAVPHKTAVPWKAIEEIGAWMKACSERRCSARAAVILAAQMHLLMTDKRQKVLEQGVFIGERNELFAVQSTPVEAERKLKGCILLLNSGSVHHVGPNAIYTQMARKLTEEGFVVLRMDLKNIGDSLVYDPDMENHPYQPKALDDALLAVAYFREQFPDTPITISGVCSGAYNAFQVGLSASSVSQLLMINPLTFYWRPNMSLELPNDLQLLRKQSGYKKSMRNLDKWKGLLRNPRKLADAVVFINSRLIKLVVDISKDFWAMAEGSKKPLARDLEAIWSRGVRAKFIFSSRDPGLDIVNSEARWALRKGVAKGMSAVYQVPEADHTFSTRAARERLLSLIATAYSHEINNQDV